jgi:hypothetical protein
VSAVTGGGHVDVKGGSVVLIAGIIGVALGVLFWMVPSKSAKMTIGIIAIVGGLLAVAIGLAWALSKELVRNTVADKLADQRGLSHSVAERQLKQAEDSGSIKTSTQPGVWLALGGGLLVLLGGIGGVSSARKVGSPSVPPAAGRSARLPRPQASPGPRHPKREGPGQDPPRHCRRASRRSRESPALLRGSRARAPPPSGCARPSSRSTPEADESSTSRTV